MCMNHTRVPKGDRSNHLVLTALAGSAGLWGADYMLSHIGIALLIFTIYALAIAASSMMGVWALLAQFLVR